jgi:stearoyl-CoA desaturase (delta-9 desaturase)
MNKREYGWLVSAPFFGAHVAAVAGIWALGWSWKGFAIAVAMYYVRMFGVTGGYHRYFAHRTYRTSRAFQFFLAVLAQSSLQKGALWWAAHHRDHHKHSDTKQDPHSWREYGFWYSHIGWILAKESDETKLKNIQDLSRYPELRWLNTWHLIPGVAMGFGSWLVGSWFGLTWWFVSTVMLWHGTFAVNSLAHWWGRRRYPTTDDSKNSLAIALLTMGEGWHNNHHYYQRSVRQGFFWWEIDVTFYVLKACEKLGLVWDLQLPPQKVLDGKLEEVRPRALTPSPAPVAVPITVETTVEAAAE